ncbi:toxin-antitoxin system YwqK family antitoxin [Salinimicrobium sp. CAU 1759]
MIRFYCSLILVCIFTLNTYCLRAQEEIKQYDSDGLRHGTWVEYFDNSQLHPKFEGQFHHGERVGLFKFYQEGLKQPVALMEFDTTSKTVGVKYLSQKGKIISQGIMADQQRTGVWTYFHKNSDKVMMTETYSEGKLHGPKKVFYDNGALAEEANYENGRLKGIRKLFSVKGVVLEDLTYRNGELHGPAKFFNGKGELMSEGQYRDNEHHGVWLYYENGKLKEEKIFK